MSNWESELTRRVAASLICSGDRMYEQLLEEYRWQPSDACEADIETVEEVIYNLWTMLINDLTEADKQ